MYFKVHNFLSLLYCDGIGFLGDYTPQRETSGTAGFDLVCVEAKNWRNMFNVGLRFDIPVGYYGQIKMGMLPYVNGINEHEGVIVNRWK